MMKNVEEALKKRPIMIAGPCSVESEEQIDKTAKFVASKGLKFLRGGAYKPRTSPDSFQGLGRKGAEMLKRAAERHGLYTVSEVMTDEDLKESYDYIDIVQIGSRNMASYGLIKQIAELTKDDRKPVLLKRHFGATITELLKAADYLSYYGNDNVLLCLRGIRTFEQIDSCFRFTPDISGIIELKDKTEKPIIFDPSHSAGLRRYVGKISETALCAGADGLIIEIHPEPDSALSDKDQALFFDDFSELLEDIGFNQD
ncbi:MAG: 3-deoxy-7-phosphoheptulonate synthase [Candidatus Woesearchaeota archaeon]